VHQRGICLLGHFGSQLAPQVLYERMVTMRSSTPLVEPTTDSPGDESARSPEVAEANEFGVDPVELVQDVNDSTRDLPGLRR
jgi:hypothetical protein